LEELLKKGGRENPSRPAKEVYDEEINSNPAAFFDNHYTINSEVTQAEKGEKT